MPPFRPDHQDSARPSPRAVWPWLVWAAVSVYLFNIWTAQWLHWMGASYYEVPSRDAILHGHFWTLLSYVLAGANTNALDWTMGAFIIILLGIVAPLVEQGLPRRRFAVLCAAIVLAGVFAWLPWHWADGSSLLAGGTPLVLGLLSFWCFTVSNEPLPVRMFFVKETRPQTIFWIVLALETGSFLMFELWQTLGLPGVLHVDVDNSAQLGAMLVGWAFAHYAQGVPVMDPEERPLRGMVVRQPQPKIVSVGVRRATEAESAASSAAKSPLSTLREFREEVDRILDKINSDGWGALSVQERKILDKAKEVLRK